MTSFRKLADECAKQAAWEVRHFQIGGYFALGMSVICWVLMFCAMPRSLIFVIPAVFFLITGLWSFSLAESQFTRYMEMREKALDNAHKFQPR